MSGSFHLVLKFKSFFSPLGLQSGTMHLEVKRTYALFFLVNVFFLVNIFPGQILCWLNHNIVILLYSLILEFCVGVMMTASIGKKLNCITSHTVRNVLLK